MDAMGIITPLYPNSISSPILTQPMDPEKKSLNFIFPE